MSKQLDLFKDSYEVPRDRSKIGQATISYKDSSGILTKTTGFMDTYDFSLNPYSGCTFGCTYCYAAFFSRDKLKIENWGRWVEVKANALDLLKKKRKKPLVDKVIYMASVTDPYQPIEKRLELTRELLKEFAEHHKIRLVVQTRSPLVTRDVDLFKEIGRVQVNMTITTDDEEVRKAFEPFCPSNENRLAAIKEVNDAGVQTCITMTPLLPVKNAVQFARDLRETGTERFIIQPFHRGQKGSRFIAGTGQKALEILDDYNWGEERYHEVLEDIKAQIPDIGEGKTGFAPPI